MSWDIDEFLGLEGWNYDMDDDVQSDDQCIDEEIIKTKAAENLIYLHYHASRKKNICQICKIEKTPLWRKCGEYNMLCNACGLRQKSRTQKPV